MNDNISGIIELIELLKLLPNHEQLIVKDQEDYEIGYAIKSDFIFGNFVILKLIKNINFILLKNFYKEEKFEIYSSEKILNLPINDKQIGMSINLDDLYKNLFKENLKDSIECVKICENDKDIYKISELYNFVNYEYNENLKVYIKKLIEFGIKFYFYQENDEIIGARMFHLQNNGRIQSYCNIVHPDHRRKGIATKIMTKAIIDFQKLENYKVLSNQTTEDGYHFSKSLGFKEDGTYYIYKF